MAEHRPMTPENLRLVADWLDLADETFGVVCPFGVVSYELAELFEGLPWDYRTEETTDE